MKKQQQEIIGRGWLVFALEPSLRLFGLCLVCAATMLALWPFGVAAVEQATASNASSLKEIKKSIDTAQELLAEGKLFKAVTVLEEATKAIEEAAQLERVPSGLRGLIQRCKILKEELEIEGIDGSTITIPSLPVPAPKAVAKPAPVPAGGAPVVRLPLKPNPVGAAGISTGVSTVISFTGQVAPLLARQCGGCHIAGKKGDFQMASYEMLMRSGMVQPGVGNASRLVEVILSGDMPRGGGKVSPADLGMLMRWIDAGAVFDGGNRATPLEALAKGGALLQPPGPAVVIKPINAVALAPGDVSFAADIVPIFLKHCAGCHDADDADAGLQMVSLESIMKGGQNGPPIVPGKALESLLVKKLKGMNIEGQQMPLEKPPLPLDVIAQIEKWINQGIKLDALTPQASLESVAAVGVAKKLSHAELATIRFNAGKKLWKSAIPDEDPLVQQRDTVSVIGNVTASRLAELADAAAASSSQVRPELVEGDQPLLKGGVVIFVFLKGYDYSGFWQNVLFKERPKGMAGNAGVVGDVAYAALLLPSADNENANAEDDFKLQLVEQITAAALQGRGAPQWFATGAGRTVAMKTVARAPLVKVWRSDVPESLQRIGSAAEFLKGHGEPAALATVSGGFVSSIAASGNRLRLLTKQLDAGVAFEKAFTDVFRATPQALFEAWAAKQGLRPVRRS